MVDALLAQVIAERGDLADERTGGPGHARLLLSGRTPQRGVLREEPAREPALDQVGHVARYRVARRARGQDPQRGGRHWAAPVGSSEALALDSSSWTSVSSSCQDFSNFSTPSRSSTATTSA